MADVVGDFDEAHGDSSECAAGFHAGIAGGLSFKMIWGFAERQFGFFGELFDGARGEVRVRVDSRAHGRAAQRKFAEMRLNALKPRDAVLDLASVAAEFLPERHGRGVLQMRATNLEDVFELGGLFYESFVQFLQRRNQTEHELLQRGNVYGGGNHVVARLPAIHIVVRMNFGTEQFTRAMGDDFVGVHVRGSARTGLENVHDELVVPFSVHDFLCGLLNGVSNFAGEQTEFGIRDGGKFFYKTKRADEGPRKAEPADGKIFHGSRRLRSIAGIGGHTHFAYGVGFDAAFSVHKGTYSRFGRVKMRVGASAAILGAE